MQTDANWHKFKCICLSRAEQLLDGRIYQGGICEGNNDVIVELAGVAALGGPDRFGVAWQR